MESNLTVPDITYLVDPSKVRKGFEEPMQKEDFIIPRAKLLQALSPEVIEDGGKFRPGMIINSLTKEVLPAEFIPVFKFTNWIRFNPRNTKDANYDPAYAPGELIWRETNPEDPRVVEFGKFGPNGEPPMATKFLNFFCYFPGVNMPIVVSFSKTSFKAGKQLLNLAMVTGRDMFATKYKVVSKQEIGDAGVYFVLNVAQVSAASEDEVVLGNKLWDKFSNKPIEIHEDEKSDETQI